MGILSDLEDIIAILPYHHIMRHTGVHITLPQAWAVFWKSIIPPHPRGRRPAVLPPIHPILANGSPLASSRPLHHWDGQVPNYCSKGNAPSSASSGLPALGGPCPSSFCRLLPYHCQRSTAASRTYLARGACGHSISAAMRA